MESSYLGGFLVGALIYLMICGGLGVYVATQKGRGEAEGLWFGILFGPIGLLIVACLPTIVPAARPQRAAEEPFELDAGRIEAMRRNDEFRKAEALRIEQQRAERAARDAAWRKTEDARMAKEDEEFRAAEAARKAARLEALRRGIDPSSRWAWFKALPDVVQIAVVAILLTAPALAVLIAVVGHR